MDEAQTVRIVSTSNRVDVVAEARSDVAVDGRATVRREPGRVEIGGTTGPVTVLVPAGTDLVIGSETGRVTVSGPAGRVAVATGSGRIEIERAESVDARTRTGRVHIGECAGECCVRSESGRVEIDACGEADVATTTSRIELDNVDGPVRAHCVTGRIDLALAAAHDVEAETVSGRVSVALPEGTNCFVADDEREPPDGYDCVVRARSVTGRVNVTTGSS